LKVCTRLFEFENEAVQYVLHVKTAYIEKLVQTVKSCELVDIFKFLWVGKSVKNVAIFKWVTKVIKKLNIFIIHLLIGFIYHTLDS
jgi:hypothetical protein